jgi:hypothetical protein
MRNTPRLTLPVLYSMRTFLVIRHQDRKSARAHFGTSIIQSRPRRVQLEHGSPPLDLTSHPTLNLWHAWQLCLRVGIAVLDLLIAASYTVDDARLIGLKDKSRHSSAHVSGENRKAITGSAFPDFLGLGVSHNLPFREATTHWTPLLREHYSASLPRCVIQALVRLAWWLAIVLA